MIAVATRLIILTKGVRPLHEFMPVKLQAYYYNNQIVLERSEVISLDFSSCTSNFIVMVLISLL